MTLQTGRSQASSLDTARRSDQATGVDRTPAEFAPPAVRVWPRLGLAAASGALLVPAFAPFNQAWLGWFGLVPWLLAVTRCRTARSAAGVGYVGGVVYFAILFWWLWHATFAGTFILLLYLSTWWALAAALIWKVAQRFLTVSPGPETHACKPAFHPIPALFVIPAIWTATEFLRGGAGGMFPWFALSQTQVPILPLCQISDVTGHWGVTFWVVMCNTLVLMACMVRKHLHRLIPAAGVWAVVTFVLVGYGLWRMRQAECTPGPNILVIQCNFPHARGGARTVTQQQQIDFHFKTTQAALTSLQNSRQKPDLIVWSETVMPPLNAEVRAAAGGAAFLNKVHADLEQLVAERSIPLLFGAYAVPTVQAKGAPASEADIRNAAYLYSPSGPVQRYDKIRLVPFGEYVWFKDTIPWLHRLLFKAAAYAVDYVITPGAAGQNIVFAIHPRDAAGSPGPAVKFVTPICMEDMDSGYVAGMFRGPGGKRAQLLLNITNDGWFNAFEKAQHLQAAIFRSIENRVWTARANNTGMSGFIDSNGSVVQMLGADGGGWAMQRVGLDRRLTVYTRLGDVFGLICIPGSLLGLVLGRRRA